MDKEQEKERIDQAGPVASVTGLEDIVFAKRNLGYGAYRLRLQYSRNMAIGAFLSILFVVAILLLSVFKWPEKEEEWKMQEIELTAPPPLALPQAKSGPVHKPESPQKPVKKPEPKISKGSTPKVVKEIPSEPAKNDPPIDSTQAKSIAGERVNDGDDGSAGPVDFAEVMPHYPGGNLSLSRFIASKLVYPNTAVTNRVEGVVIVGFIVDKDGKVRQPRIIKSLYPACDEEALRVVRLIPEWIPARNKNRTVSFNYRMPIEFRLNR